MLSDLLDFLNNSPEERTRDKGTFLFTNIPPYNLLDRDCLGVLTNYNEGPESDTIDLQNEYILLSKRYNCDLRSMYQKLSLLDNGFL